MQTVLQVSLMSENPNLSNRINKLWQQCISQPVRCFIHALNYTFFSDFAGRRRVVNTLNGRLLSIRPPHHITRLPRSLRQRCYWKAHEWRNWLLFYCLPCCRNVLAQKYLRHFALLSEAIFTLLQEELSINEVNRAGKNYISVWPPKKKPIRKTEIFLDD